MHAARDALSSLVVRGVRWGWDDLTDVDAFGRMIRQAFDNAPTYLAGG